MKHVLSVLLLFVLPAFATISQRQSPVSTWNSGSSMTCSATLGSGYHSGDLIVVWTFWSTGSSSNNLTASVTDQNNPVGSYVSAVGPTLQSGSNTAAQVFYVASSAGSGSDPVKVSYYLNGVAANASTSGCVFVEYQGADTLNPLDSVSEAISNTGSPSNALDSGTAAPANASLLVFGGGVVDSGSGLIPGAGFTSVQSSTIGTTASAITEQNSAAITTNNTFQRATACLGSGALCNTSTGNWIMQMAVFRAATWTVGQGSSATRLHNTLYADQFPGATPDVQLTNAIAAATPGQAIEYRCAPGATLPQFSKYGTVLLNIPVDIKLGPCVFQGPPGDGAGNTTNYPMFTIGAIAGEIIEGTSRWQTTTLENMCDKCDTIHFSKGTSVNLYTSEEWTIENLNFSDALWTPTNLCKGSSSRTGGTAIYMDSVDQFHGAVAFRISNVHITGMYNQIFILSGETSTLQDIRGIGAVSTGIIVLGRSTGISFLNVEEQCTEVADDTKTDVPISSGGSGTLGTGSGVHVDLSPWTSFVGGQYPGNAGCGIFTSGDVSANMNSLLLAGTEAEDNGHDYTQTTCVDGFRLQDTYGFSATGSFAEGNSHGSGFHIIGGLGSITGGIATNNHLYGVDDSGTSPVGTTQALNISGMETFVNGAGNFNDPAGVMMVLSGAHLDTGLANGDLSGTCNSTSGTTCTPVAKWAIDYTSAAPSCVVTPTSSVTSFYISTRNKNGSNPLVITYAPSGAANFTYVCHGNPN